MKEKGGYKYRCRYCGRAFLPPEKVNRWDEENYKIKHARKAYSHDERRMTEWNGKEFAIVYSVYVVKCPYCGEVLWSEKTDEPKESDKTEEGGKEEGEVKANGSDVRPPNGSTVRRGLFLY